MDELDFISTNHKEGLLAYESFLEPTEEQIGHLMILGCGHNGYFSHCEKMIFEKHLMKSGFVSESFFPYQSQTSDTIPTDDVQVRESLAGKPGFNVLAADHSILNESITIFG